MAPRSEYGLPIRMTKFKVRTGIDRLVQIKDYIRCKTLSNRLRIQKSVFEN